jgi:hypothetical protein
MQEIEKNDVDISKLFTWGKKFEITDEDQKGFWNVYIRIIGDADLNKSRVAALRASAILRRKLHEKDSDERLAYIPDFELLDRDVLVETVLTTLLREVTTKVMKNMNETLPVEPDEDSTLEEQEKYQKEVDGWSENRTKRIQILIENELEKERKILQEKSLEELSKIYEKYTINNLCEEEMYRIFSEMRAFMGSYADENFTIKVFKDFEQFNSMPAFIKNQFINAYLSLDIKTEELKK